METNFNQTDIDYILKRGNSIEKVIRQLEFFKEGITKAQLVKSATKGDGIWVFDESETNQLITYFDKHKNHYCIEKFVPASGAASRMFKFLSEFLNEYDPENDTINSYINHHQNKDLSVFLVGLKNFPFYLSVKEKVKQLYPDFLELDKDRRDYLLIKTLLANEHFNFAGKPKGVLPFHFTNEGFATPVDEHLAEASYYASKDKTTKIHFTVSEEHQKEFEQIAANYDGFTITFSYQSESTDTIAVNPDNTPFRLENDTLFFRPGGHGALIKNLNDLTSDIVFIKNIDNVSQNHLGDIIRYKKVLGGVLLRMQFLVFNYLNILEKGDFSATPLDEIITFVREKLSLVLPEDFDQYQPDYIIKTLINRLNRPIRVCGMVRNEGEPGGGPFWVKDEKGKITLQIVESSQIDFSNEKQASIANNATHFNPVDLVCGIKNYKGEKFDLTEFVDENAGFISHKTKNGKPLKAYELPGLWNGAMAKWITIFVEVPLTTFNPVKTVNDLLKPAHQPNNE